MLLPPLLRAHAYMRTESPQDIWEPDTEDVDFIPLLGEMITAALRPGSPLAALTLAAANVVVPVDHDPEAHSVPPPGEYVAVSVSGPGPWCTDWRWLPDRSSSAPVPIPLERLVVAGIRFAYGRALGASSSMTVFLARRPPDTGARPNP